MAICSDDCIRRELSHFCAWLPCTKSPARSAHARLFYAKMPDRAAASGAAVPGRRFHVRTIAAGRARFRPRRLCARRLRRRRLQESRRARCDVLRREQRPGCRPAGRLRQNGRIRRRSSSPTRRSRIPRSTRTYSSRSRQHSRQCLDKKVVFYQVQSNAAEIEAMRSGRLHVGGFSTGPTAFAVNLAGAVPFAVKGTAKEFQGYNLIVIVKAKLALPEAVRSQGQEGRPHVAVVEFRTPGAARAVPGGRTRSRQGLQDHLLGQARPVGDGRQLRRLRRRRRRLRRVPPDGASGARSRRATSASSTAARNSRPRRSRTRTTSIRSSSTRC